MLVRSISIIIDASQGQNKYQLRQENIDNICYSSIEGKLVDKTFFSRLLTRTLMLITEEISNTLPSIIIFSRNDVWIDRLLFLLILWNKKKLPTKNNSKNQIEIVEHI